MNEAILQALFTITYLAIGLISVSFPIYAISVNYLKQERNEADTEKTRKIQQIKQQIDSLTTQLCGKSKDSDRFKDIQKLIKKCEKEQKKLESGVLSLSAMGAVFRPLYYLVIVLISTSIGMYYYYEQSPIVYAFLVLATGLSGLSLYCLFKTILGIERAVLRTGRTVQFKVRFKSGQNPIKMKLNEEKPLSIGVTPIQERVELIHLQVFYPPEFELVKYPHNKPILQPAGMEFEGYNMIRHDEPFSVPDVYCGFSVLIKPKKIGEYNIPVLIYGKGIEAYKTNLNIVVN